MNGRDVSNNNLQSADIDGADFLYIKATQGTNFVDPDSGAWNLQARAKGIKTGFYHFAEFDHNAPEVEAQFFLAHSPVSLCIPAVDVESRPGVDPLSVLGPQELANRVNRFCAVVYSERGGCLYYMDRYYFGQMQSYLDPGYGLWLATASGAPSLNHINGRPVVIEQWGIAHGVDQDIAYSDILVEDDMQPGVQYQAPDNTIIVVPEGGGRPWIAHSPDGLQIQIDQGSIGAGTLPLNAAQYAGLEANAET